MSFELIYTSVPRGLKPGSRGFCTVACTKGIAPNLVKRLESLSGYRHVFPPTSADADENPLVYSHLRINVGGYPYHVLSRVCSAGLDYTERTNKFAHHFVLEPHELPGAGPAELLTDSRVMESEWKGEPGLITTSRAIPTVVAEPKPCNAWKAVTGNAGWAGAVAETAVTGRKVVLLFKPGMDPVVLLREALALLPIELQWNVTFNTFFTKLPSGIDCQWCCVLADTPEAVRAKGQRDVLLIDLTVPMPAPSESAATLAAEQGRLVAQPSPQKPKPAGPPPLGREPTVDAVATPPAPSKEEAGTYALASDSVVPQSDVPASGVPRQKFSRKIPGSRDAPPSSRPDASKRWGWRIFYAFSAVFLLALLAIGAVFLGPKFADSVDSMATTADAEKPEERTKPREPARLQGRDGSSRSESTTEDQSRQSENAHDALVDSGSSDTATTGPADEDISSQQGMDSDNNSNETEGDTESADDVELGEIGAAEAETPDELQASATEFPKQIDILSKEWDTKNRAVALEELTPWADKLAIVDITSYLPMHNGAVEKDGRWTLTKGPKECGAIDIHEGTLRLTHETGPGMDKATRQVVAFSEWKIDIRNGERKRLRFFHPVSVAPIAHSIDGTKANESLQLINLSEPLEPYGVTRIGNITDSVCLRMQSASTFGDIPIRWERSPSGDKLKCSVYEKRKNAVYAKALFELVCELECSTSGDITSTLSTFDRFRDAERTLQEDLQYQKSDNYLQTIKEQLASSEDEEKPSPKEEQARRVRDTKERLEGIEKLHDSFEKMVEQGLTINIEYQAYLPVPEDEPDAQPFVLIQSKDWKDDEPSQEAKGQ